MPSEVTTWKRWRAKHPGTTVLDPPLGAAAYAGTNAWYRKYRQTDRMMFPEGAAPIDARFRRKDNVTIAYVDGKPRCYPHPLLEEGETRDGDLVIVKEGISVRVLDAEGAPVPSMLAYWYAWCALYEGGTVYAPPAKK